MRNLLRTFWLLDADFLDTRVLCIPCPELEHYIAKCLSHMPLLLSWSLLYFFGGGGGGWMFGGTACACAVSSTNSSTSIGIWKRKARDSILMLKSSIAVPSSIPLALGCMTARCHRLAAHAGCQRFDADQATFGAAWLSWWPFAGSIALGKFWFNVPCQSCILSDSKSLLAVHDLPEQEPYLVTSWHIPWLPLCTAF